MLVIYVLQFLGLIVRQNLITNQITSTVVSTGDREVQNSTQGGFFRGFGQFSGAGFNFNFTVLPFGLSFAGHIFTKTVRVLVKYWRSLGFPIVVYLDDGFATAVDYEGCETIYLQVQNDLLSSGFIVNTEKCMETNTIVRLVRFGVELKKFYIRNTR